jgi:hypothetical protein
MKKKIQIKHSLLFGILFILFFLFQCIDEPRTTIIKVNPEGTTVIIDYFSCKTPYRYVNAIKSLLTQYKSKCDSEKRECPLYERVNTKFKEWKNKTVCGKLENMGCFGWFGDRENCTYLDEKACYNNESLNYYELDSICREIIESTFKEVKIEEQPDKVITRSPFCNYSKKELGVKFTTGKVIKSRLFGGNVLDLVDTLNLNPLSTVPNHTIIVELPKSARNIKVHPEKQLIEQKDNILKLNGKWDWADTLGDILKDEYKAEDTTFYVSYSQPRSPLSYILMGGFLIGYSAILVFYVKKGQKEILLSKTGQIPKTQQIQKTTKKLEKGQEKGIEIPEFDREFELEL